MISASSNPSALGSWLGLVARGLLVGFPPVCNPVAFDGALTRATAGSLGSAATMSLTSSPIPNTAGLYTRRIERLAGSFVDDGWLPGYTVAIANSAVNDGLYRVVDSVDDLTLVLTPSPEPFMAETLPPAARLGGEAPDGFAFYIGPQWRDAWTGGNMCVLVPAELAEAQPQSFRNVPGVLSAHHLILDVHIWGAKPEGVGGILQDIGRYAEADLIWQEVRRAIQVASRGLGVAIQSAPFDNDTEVLRHGESLVARLQVASFPVFDAAPQMAPHDLSLIFSMGIKPPAGA